MEGELVKIQPHSAGEERNNMSDMSVGKIAAGSVFSHCSVTIINQDSRVNVNSPDAPEKSETKVKSPIKGETKRKPPINCDFPHLEIAAFDRKRNVMLYHPQRGKTAVVEEQQFNEDMKQYFFTAIALAEYVYILLQTQATYRLCQKEPEKSWDKLSSMNKNHGKKPPAVACDGKIFVVGSGGLMCEPSSAVESFDPHSDQWTVLISMNIPRLNHALAVIGNTIYTIGGFSLSKPLATERYTAVNKKWETLDDKCKSRDNIFALVINDKIYLVRESRREILRFDEGCWTQVDPGEYAMDTIIAGGGILWGIRHNGMESKLYELKENLGPNRSALIWEFLFVCTDFDFCAIVPNSCAFTKPESRS